MARTCGECEQHRPIERAATQFACENWVEEESRSFCVVPYGVKL